MGNKDTSIQGEEDFKRLCDELASDDQSLSSVIRAYGYPPFWSRPNTFESLVQIILEQQVSLLSAKAAYERLKRHTGDITPSAILRMSDDEFKRCSFSRQKMTYVRGLANSIQSDRLDLDNLVMLDDNSVRAILIKEKGIGNWTIDIYLIEILHRKDVLPVGDIAAIRAINDIYHIDHRVNGIEFNDLIQTWKPYRTMATMLLWHHYLASRGRSEEMIASK